MLNSRSGRAMMAIRDYHIAADTMGIDTALYKTVTFGISAAYTGIAGALSASAIAFVAPDSFNIFLSIKFLIGLVVGGIGSLTGSVVGGIFYVLVDNSAQALSTFVKNDLGLQFDLSAYTVFGILLIVLMYLMPMGIVGGVYFLVRSLRGAARRAGRQQAPQSQRRGRPRPARATSFVQPYPSVRSSAWSNLIQGGRTMKTSRRTFVGGVSAAAVLSGSRVAFAQKKYDDGATDKEIKIGHTNPYSGPASSYGVIGKTIEAYWKSVNEAGGINGRKVKFITLDDGYSPPKTVELVRQLVEQDKVLCTFNTLGTPTNTAIHKYMNQKKVPHALRRHRRVEVGQAQGVPVDDGLPARLPHRGRDLRQAHPGQRQGRQDRRADAERRLRQGLLGGLQGRPRQGRRQGSSST